MVPSTCGRGRANAPAPGPCWPRRATTRWHASAAARGAAGSRQALSAACLANEALAGPHVHQQGHVPAVNALREEGEAAAQQGVAGLARSLLGAGGAGSTRSLGGTSSVTS